MNNRDVIASLIFVAVVAIVGLSSVYQVYETQQALVVQFGNPQREIREPGLHFKWPWEAVTLLDKRVLLLDLPAQEVITSDQKRVLVDAYARFRIVDTLKFYQTVRDERMAANRLDTIVNSTIRQVIGDEPFTSLLTPERIALRERVRAAVNAEGAQMGIDVMDVRIKRANLPEENSEAIFKRMKAERERLAKEGRAQGAEQAQKIKSGADRERTVILAEAQRDAEIIRGEGDSKAIKIFAEAFGRDPEFYAFYRSMQSYTKALSKDDTTMILAPGSGFLEYFDEGKATGKK
jgi:membrane protease subunit HflC